jgi:uncharacterized membrane-anchored protein
VPILPADHADRLRLADEVHARPPEALATPSRATYVAVLVEPASRALEMRRIAELCAANGAPTPADGATHVSADLGGVRLKWERHGEFSGYTLVAAGPGATPFGEPPARLLPDGWLAAVPGRTIFAAHATLMAGDRPADGARLESLFGASVVVGSEVAGGAGWIYTDFRIRDDGFSRIVVVNHGLTERQSGRMLQRLFEIEAYRMLSLLALPVARQQAGRLADMESRLAAQIDGIARDDSTDEAILHDLTQLSRDVESCIVASQFRFGACAAYQELVSARIAELREQRLGGLQTVEEFMARRFSPAVATVASTSRRLRELADRVAQGCTLLSTRVGIARERQNQALLESMNRRARQQLRLQETVEGLSIAAILYYLAGLTGYAAKALKAGGLHHLDTDLVVGAAIVPLAALLLWSLRRARRRIAAGDRTPLEKSGGRS